MDDDKPIIQKKANFDFEAGFVCHSLPEQPNRK